MKEGMSSFDIAVIAMELNNLIRGSRIGKIYQINHKILLLKLRNPKGENIQLLIEAGRRIHLTSYSFEKPKKPPSFCMALRKYLEEGVIEDIRQYDFERIIELSINCKSQTYQLLAELFNEGNIILIGPENKILHALIYRRMKDRNILRGEDFTYPPRRGEDPKSISIEKFHKIKELGQVEVVIALTRFLGIGGFYAEEILLRSGVDKNRRCSSLSEEDLNIIFNGMRDLLFQIETKNWRPCIFVNNEGEWIDVAPFPLKKYSGSQIIEMKLFNEALDEYYGKISAKGSINVVKKRVELEIARLERILQKQEGDLRELKAKADTYRQIGNIIYNHLYEVDSLLTRIMNEKRSGKSWAEISELIMEEGSRSIAPSTHFVSINPELLTLQVSIDGQSFDLNLKLSAQRNAAEYYKKAKKSENKIEGLERAIAQTKNEIEKAKTEISMKMEAASKNLYALKRKREWYEKFRWFFSSEGFLVIGGKDLATNDILVKKYLEPHDMVFHADIPGSPFVVIKTQGKIPSEKTINETAQFTASYSRAWKESFRAIDVYWVSPEQVSKTPPSGQYLPRGSFMIYGVKHYVRGVPLETAIGIKKEDDQLRVIGGPIEAIAKQASIYLRIIPGKDQSGVLAKNIRNRLAAAAPPEDREKILRIPLEEVQAFIPAGRGSIG